MTASLAANLPPWERVAPPALTRSHPDVLPPPPWPIRCYATSSGQPAMGAAGATRSQGVDWLCAIGLTAMSRQF